MSASANSVSVVHVVSLRSQYPSTLLGLPGETPLLSWSVECTVSGLTQLAYEIEVSDDSDFAKVAATSGVVKSNEQIAVEAPGSKLSSRDLKNYRVRVQTQAGWSDWSGTYTYEAGLLSRGDFVGSAISDGSAHSDPVALMRKDFNLSGEIAKARIYASAQGVYDLSINGVPVVQEYLNPGWTSYDFRLNVATFDVTNLVSQGQNALGIKLGDGWFRGKLGFMNQFDNYGSRTSVIAQLEVTYADGKVETIATDESFKTSTGQVRFADIYDGTVIDQNLHQPGWDKAGFADSGWKNVSTVDLDKKTLVPRIAEPIKKIEEFSMTLVKHSDRVQLDAGQNIAGWVRLVVDGKKGQKVVVRHSEVLESDGRLHTKALRTAKATDTYILGSDGRHVLEPEFTFHGFQHADVVTEAEVISGVGVAISSAAPTRSTFSTSDTRLNRLHENVVWSQRDNFVGLPTDCPQRDERLGWTGDAQAFAYAANTLVNAEAFWRSWLIDLELDQDENGDVGAVVPDILKRQPTPGGEWVISGRAGWADAATIVPFATYETFGSKDILVQQLSSIRRWVDALHNRRNGGKLLPTEFQFGDWCDPDAPGNRPWESKVSADFVANAFFAHSADLAVKIERLVGSESEAQRFEAMSAQVKSDLWSLHGTSARKTTAGCAIALEFEICPDSEREAVAKELASMVRADKGKIATGFLGTPLILHAMSKSGYASEAYLMLMRREIRSWLYQVDAGATTIWERWDAIGEHGEIHSGAMDTATDAQEDPSMISFNHYAYGAVVDWMYRNVVGLAPVESEPGYRRTIVAPLPAEGFSFAKAAIDTSFGCLKLEWKISDNGDLIACLEVPFGITAELNLPLSANSTATLNGATIANGSEAGYGSHVIVVTNPAIVQYK